MNRKKLTVTIGIPAYNEEENIAHLLKSILKQKEKSYWIENITVISDGSEDKTVAIVQKYMIKDKRIQLIEDHNRKGKPRQLNRLFNSIDTDILVIIDADMICSDKNTLENLVSKFGTKVNPGLVSGNVQPMKARTYIEGAINNYLEARKSVEDDFDFGKTGYSIHGFVAYSKNLLKRFNFPTVTLSNDSFSYYSCKKLKFKNIFARDSIMLFRSPDTINDYARQMIRYQKAGIQTREYFGNNTVNKYTKIPTKIRLRIMWHQLKKDPLAYIILKFITFYCRLYGNLSKTNTSSKWVISKSSKKLIW